MIDEVSLERYDVLDCEWEGPRGFDPLEVLLDASGPQIQAQSIMRLARAAEMNIAADPILMEASTPARIFGDIHGQFRDLLLLLHDFGFAGRGPTCIFNGDWVDRGSHQLETITLLFALKVVYPDKVKLVRGNHEDPEMNRHMGEFGFPYRCVQRLGQDGKDVFRVVSRAFEWLPLACLIDDQVLVLHGGIGAGNWSLDYLRSVIRPLSHDDLAMNPVLWNILWSDPIPDEAQDHFGVHDSPRDNHQHLMLTFGKDVTQFFCQRNGLEMIVRSHQALMGGCGYEVMHSGRCVRVFSARDYEGCKNDGSVLLVTRSNATGKLHMKPQVLRSLAKIRKEMEGRDSSNGSWAFQGVWGDI